MITAEDLLRLVDELNLFISDDAQIDKGFTFIFQSSIYAHSISLASIEVWCSESDLADTIGEIKLHILKELRAYLKEIGYIENMLSLNLDPEGKKP